MKPSPPFEQVRSGARRIWSSWRAASPLWPLLAILVLAAILRFWRLGDAALIGDESYYWLWSERLAPSYYDNPAGVALMVRLSTLAGGQGEAGIRWLNALLGVGAAYLAYAICARLLSERAAYLSAALLAVGAPYLVLSRFVYTDMLQLLLLLLNVLLLAPFLPQEDRASSSAIPTWRFWAAALSTAALLNTKYSAYLYALVTAVFLAVRRPSLLHDRRTWWAAGGALLGLLPAVAWNATHGWASYRWQFAHFVRESLHPSSFAGRMWHVVRYLTPPIALLALPGITQLRGARRQMLCVPALALALPILLSPADSPRNVVAGATLLLLLGCDAMCRWAMRLFRYVPFPTRTGPRLLAILVFLWSGVYGVGTVLETQRPTHWPHSSVAPAIRQDSLGWRSLPDLGKPRQALIFAVDYSIASQLRYYAGQPVQTAWGQYRVWGIPELERPPQPEDQALIVALSFVEPDLISRRLQAAFVETSGPTRLLLKEGNETKTLHVWAARGRQVDGERFLQMFDLLDLVKARQMNSEQQGENP